MPKKKTSRVAPAKLAKPRTRAPGPAGSTHEIVIHDAPEPLKGFKPDAAPILKWAGGKRSLVPTIVQLLPTDDRFYQYDEPFCGGAALYLAIHKRLAARRCSSSIGDANRRLANFYRTVRVHPAEVANQIAKLEKCPYDELVAIVNTHARHSPTEAAAFLLVNRRCFNGLWRENSYGMFNTPKGTSNRGASRNEIDVLYQALAEISIESHGFSIDPDQRSFEGDFFYLDPPYDETFSGYIRGGFGRGDQIQLAANLHTISRKGGLWMLSTSDTPLIRELYRGFDFTAVATRRSVGGAAKTRKPVTELVIRNYSGVRTWP